MVRESRRANVVAGSSTYNGIPGRQFVTSTSKAKAVGIEEMNWLNVRIGKPGASCVTVSIQREDNAVKIIVEDDGAGMSATRGGEHPAGEGGFGLFSIEERMNDLGGSLSIESPPGQGVRAILTVPFEVE